jgi:ADP-heptose:LPS heptosyltransferase
MTGPDRGLNILRLLISEERPDAVFILPYASESLGSKLKKLLFFRLAGFHGYIFGLEGLATQTILRNYQHQLGLYEHQVYGPVRAIGECPTIGTVTEEEIVQRLTIPEAASQWAREVVDESWLDGRPLVAIAPGASFPHKMWPIERFVAASQELHQEYGCRFVVVGTDADRLLGAKLAESLGIICLDMTGRTTVTQLAALLNRCRLFVGNDSGPAHVASAVDCPCVTVTSALEFPGIWEPWNSRQGVARTRIDCEFCQSLTCCPLKTNACILAIGTDEVLRLCRPAFGVHSTSCLDHKSAVASRQAVQL